MLKPVQSAQVSLAEHAAEIKRLGKRVMRDIIEIGRRLAEAKEITGRGNWLLWLDREFGWTERTARNFMQVHAAWLKSADFADLDVPVSGLYLLAAPSTSGKARDEVIERALRGDRLSLVDVKRTIAKHKPGKANPAVMFAGPMYVMSEFADHELVAQFGPFASQADAMNYAEAERTGKGADRWLVTPVIEPHTKPAMHLSQSELLLRGWRAATVDPRSPHDLAAQTFRKDIVEVEVECPRVHETRN